MPLIFVYGTLKHGSSNHAQLAGQQYLGTTRTVPGYRLYHLGEYPGMVPHPADHAGVEGEVWQVDDACLARLDVFEGVPQGLYRREPIRLASPFDQNLVETYIYAGPTAGLPEAGPSWNE